MKRKVVLITGANGFLARSLARQMHGEWHMIGLVRPEAGLPSNCHATYDSIDNLISDCGAVDVVMHLAARIPSRQNTEPADLVATNVDLVATLVKAYPAARHVLASSVSVYGIPKSLPITITTSPNQPNSYGLSKLAAEQRVHKASSYSIIRFSSLIGVGMKSGTFIPTIISAARLGKIELIGNGERLQNYLDIDDAASICIQAAASKQSFVALGVSHHSYSNNYVAALVAELTGASISRCGEDPSPSYVYETKGAVELGRPFISLKESLIKILGDI